MMTKVPWPSTAAAIGALTWRSAVGTSVRHGAAASRSCVCEDIKTEGGCCCQDRDRARAPETGRPAGAAAAVLCPDRDVDAGGQERVGAGQREAACRLLAKP